MKRALHSVESTGDTVAFAAELSTSFFTTLQEACQSFRTLFEEHFEKVEILNLLLVWVQQQVNVYVEILVPAVSLCPLPGWKRTSFSCRGKCLLRNNV